MNDVLRKVERTFAILLTGGGFLLMASTIGLVRSWDVVSQVVGLSDPLTRFLFSAAIIGFYLFVGGTMVAFLTMLDAFMGLATPQEPSESE